MVLFLLGNAKEVQIHMFTSSAVRRGQCVHQSTIVDRQPRHRSSIVDRQSIRRSTIVHRQSRRRSTIVDRQSRHRSTIVNRQSRHRSSIANQGFCQSMQSIIDCQSPSIIDCQSRFRVSVRVTYVSFHLLVRNKFPHIYSNLVCC